MMNISLTSFSGFFPVILESLGYSSVRTQLLTIPVYVCIAVVLVILGAISDRTKKRGIFLAMAFAVAAAGWLMLLLSTSKHLSYAGCFLVGMGTYPQVTLIQSWMSMNIIGYTKRAGALAFIMIFGQCFALMGLEIFTDAPKYHRGKGLGFASAALSALLVPFFIVYIRRLNQKKEKEKHTSVAAEKRRLGIEEVCDDHPDFRYWL
ncbi:hypothetical protein LTS15_006706 [Exophiala xenobiotica]|nr:hypothetical protein LTS15_006706 [Exophiala xenobiotica]